MVMKVEVVMIEDNNTVINYHFRNDLACEESADGWLGFYVPINANMLRLVIGNQQIIMKNPYQGIN